MRIEMSRYEVIQQMSVRELAEMIVATQVEGIRVGLQMEGVEFDPTTIDTEEAINEMVDRLLEVEMKEIKIGEENGNIEKNIWRMEVDVVIHKDEENIRTQTVILKANDVEEAVERAVGRFAMNCGKFIRIAGVRGEKHKDDSRT